MQKLSKEQAEWLIEKLKSNYNVYCPKCAINCDIDKDPYLIKIINQCTETKFPQFEFQTQDSGSYVVRKPINAPHAEYIVIDLDGSTAFLNPQQFKAFTQGCIEIVEWLNEQEAN